MKYIMSGDEGLIGTFLSKRLKKEKHECVMSIDLKNNENVNGLPYMGNIKTDMFIHLAAQCKINEAIKHPMLPFKNNVEGIHNVLEYCKRNEIPKIMVASSSRVLSPQKNPYTASKIYVEELTKGYSDCYGLEYIIIRPSTVYGPKKDVTPRLMHTWVENAYKDKEMPVFGDKDKTLDFTYISDFVDATMLLINNWDNAKNQAYNISGDQETKVVDVGNMIIKEMSGGHLEFYPEEIAQPQKVHVDTELIKVFGYKPKVGIKKGIKKMCDYFKNE